jgi:cobalt/nickel transport protein
MTLIKKMWIGIMVLVLLSPLGLILPHYFKAGAAWGEWGPDEISTMAGYVPRGMTKLSSFWNAPLPGYAFKGWTEKGLTHLSFAYIITAILGVGAVALVMYFLGKVLVKKND